jgi:hypothetical protein
MKDDAVLEATVFAYAFFNPLREAFLVFFTLTPEAETGITKLFSISKWIFIEFMSVLNKRNIMYTSK